MLYININTPSGLLFKGNVLSVTGYNPNGKFDILDNHASFISIIEKKLVLQIDKTKTKEFDVERGVLKAINNEIKVYFGF
jgi:F0F1-type ATP synthase epsilon subunit